MRRYYFLKTFTVLLFAMTLVFAAKGAALTAYADRETDESDIITVDFSEDPENPVTGTFDPFAKTLVLKSNGGTLKNNPDYDNPDPGIFRNFITEKAVERVIMDKNSHMFLPQDCGELFYGCSSLVSIDTAGWDTSRVSRMAGMFDGCTDLALLDVSGFNTDMVTDMSRMFHRTRLVYIDVSGFNTDNVISMYSMFRSCADLRILDVSGFSTDRVRSMAGMFSGCARLKVLNVSNFATGAAQSMSYMFEGCSSAGVIDVSSFDTSNVKAMDCMFKGCSSVETLDLSSFDTDGVGYMECMFEGCSSLVSVDLGGLDTGMVWSMKNMFKDCSSLTAVDVSGFDTTSATRMDNMFRGCAGLTELDISNFDTSRVTAFGGMFSGCAGLTKLDLTNFDPGKNRGSAEMFSGCSSLKEIYVKPGTEWKIASGGDSSSMFAGAESLPGYKSSSVKIKMAKTVELGGYFVLGPQYSGNIEYAKVTGIKDKTYTSKSIEQTPVVKINGKALKAGKDYTLSYKNNKNAGTATVIITGTGDYTGSVTKTFIINPKQVTPDVTLAHTSYTWNGSTKKPAVTVKIGDTTLKKSGYTVSYEDGRKNVGTYKVTVTLKGNYVGSKTVSFTINPKGTGLKSLTAESKGILVKWVKQTRNMSKSRVSGYQIQIARDSEFTTGKKLYTIDGFNNASELISGLKGNRQYFVRIRTFKTVDDVNYYSAWSEAESVTTLK